MATNDEIFEYAQQVKNDLQSEVESALAELKTAAASRFEPSTSQAGFNNNPDWTVADLSDITMPGLGDLPADRPALNLPAFSYNPEDYIRADLLQRYSYVSEFFDNFLDARLRTYIDSQGYFLAQSVQDALFEQMYQRDLQTLNDSLDAVTRQQARRGFPMPTSMLTAARNEVIKRYMDTRNDRNKEVTALIADKSLQEKMHAIDAGIRMEDIRSRFQLEFGRLYWQAADYIIRKYEADVRAELARFNAETELLKLKADIDLRGINVDVERERMVQAKQLARLQVTVQEVRENVATWTQAANMSMSAVGAAVQYYGNAVLGVQGQVNAVNYDDVTNP